MVGRELPLAFAIRDRLRIRRVRVLAFSLPHVPAYSRGGVLAYFAGWILAAL